MYRFFLFLLIGLSNSNIYKLDPVEKISSIDSNGVYHDRIILPPYIIDDNLLEEIVLDKFLLNRKLYHLNYNKKHKREKSYNNKKHD